MNLNLIQKSGLVSAVAIATCLLPAQAQLTHDPFATGGTDYTAAALLSGQGPAVTGYTSSWENGSNQQVVATSLIYSDPSYLGSSGGSILAASNSGRVGRELDSGYDSSSTETVYLSFLMQTLTNNNTTQYKAFELHNGAGYNDGANRTFQLGVQNGNFGSTTNFGFRVNNDNGTITQLGALNTDVNLFVVKFEFSDIAASDSITVWQNPTITGSEPVGGATVSSVDFAFDRTTFARFNNDDQIAWDEVRLGSTFNSVVPEPSSYALIVGCLTLAGISFQRRRK